MANHYALYVTASFHGQIVEESFVRSGEPLQLGHSSALAVPVPEGLEYIARVLWTSRDTCTVRDGYGNMHEVTPEQDLSIEAGVVSLRLSLARQYRLKRAQRLSGQLVLVWAAMFVLLSLTSSQAVMVSDNHCLFRALVPFVAQCPPADEGNGGGAFTAEYLARLLDKDFDGEDQGVIAEIERPDAEKETKQYLPAGNEGPITAMGGAEDVSRDPVRSDADEIPVVPREQANNVPLYVEDGTEIPPEEVNLEEVEGEVDGFDDPIEAEEPQDEALPSEEEEGWGIPDWYDEQDKRVEEIEIEVMLELAQRRLRIDPTDPASLSLLSYYQYLAGSYDDALETYDTFIELYPEESAGYNNKALVYKRRGDYAKEESLYRTALYFRPNDVTTLNNLAVNLAHQKRFEEALAIMTELETLDPGDPYADLHRAKVHAEIGNDDLAISYLRQALEGMAKLDTLHHIEFRQDIRLDPSFAGLRETRSFREVLNEFYGDDSPLQE